MVISQSIHAAPTDWEYFAGMVDSIFETARLRLRPFEDTDIEPYANILRKSDVVRFLPNEADTGRAIEPARRAITQWGKAAWNDGYAPWAVVHRDSNALIGHAGLRKSDTYHASELLYMFDDTVWRSGYAAEAALAACQFAKDHLGLNYVMAVALYNNHGSIAVMKKCGLKFECEFQSDNYRLVRYGIHFSSVED